MEKVVIQFSEKAAFRKANEYFIRICGFHEDNDKNKKMLSLAMASRMHGMDGIRIKAVISSFDPEVFQDHKIVIEGTELICPAFEQIVPHSVKKIYLYALTVGGCHYQDDDGIMRQLFSDIWGTAYTDSARDLLEEHIKTEMELEFSDQMYDALYLSDAFGPGYYGMDIIQTKDLYRLLSAHEIGIEVKDSGIMLPLKSCSGLYFAVTDAGNLPRPNCRDCAGNHMGCSFCKFR